MDINIVEAYKQSNSKLEIIEKLAKETGKSIPEIFVELSEAKCCDGRFFRQGRYAKEWSEAKKLIKEANLKQAQTATTSLSDLKKENEKLREQLEKLKSGEPLKVSVSDEEFEKIKAELEAFRSGGAVLEVNDAHEKTISTQKAEIDRLNAEIESMTNSYHDERQQMQDEYDAASALIEDLRSVVSLREDEVKELNAKIGELEKSVDHHKVSDFNSTADNMVLESKLKSLEEKNSKLLERIRGLEEENEELKCTNCADDIRKQLDETTQNYNSAMLVNKKLEEQVRLLEDEKEGDGLIITDQMMKISEFKKKLAKAEEFVLNQVLYS